MRPSLGADLLAPGEAVLAQDVRLTAGELRPLNGLLAGVSLTATTIKSIYRFGQTLSSITQYWFQAAGDVDYVRGPVANDTTERTYFTDGVFPKKTDASIATGATPYPSASYAMGLPAPAAAPTVTVTGSPTNSASVIETVVFTYTYVSPWGEEGPPSTASTSVNWQAGQTLNISGMSASPGTGPQGQNYNVNGKRLYRSALGTQSTQYQLVNTGATIALATTTYTDTTVTASLGDVLATVGWLEPLYNMTGLCAGPNGMMAGFAGNTLCFSVPGVPSAWPARYQQATNAPIIGIAWFDQTVFVGTSAGVYLFTGADPANMSGGPIATVQAVVSKRSIVAMLGGVIFASSDGLYRIDSNGGPVNLPAGIMTRADWEVYTPSTFSAYESESRYIAFYDNGTTQASLIFSFSPESSFVKSTLYMTAGFRDKKAASLFLTNAAAVLYQYDKGSALTYTWTSGVFHLAGEENAGRASVDAAAYPVTFQLYADGALKATQTVADKYAFSLPAGYRSSRYSFSLSGTSIVRSVEIASVAALMSK